MSRSQQDSTRLSEIAGRLREERYRIEPHQGHFAKRLGLNQGKWSHLEQGRSEIKALDLARLASNGIDVHYVLTGNRIDLGLLEGEDAEAMGDLLALPIHARPIARAVLRAIRASAGEGGIPKTLHAPGLSYRPAPAPAPLPGEAALAEMFGALLEASPGLEGGELAHELARRLPTMLDAARDRPLGPGLDEADPLREGDEDREGAPRGARQARRS